MSCALWHVYGSWPRVRLVLVAAPFNCINESSCPMNIPDNATPVMHQPLRPMRPGCDGPVSFKYSFDSLWSLTICCSCARRFPWAMRLSTVTFTLLKTGKPCLQANAHLIYTCPATEHLCKMSSCKPHQVLDRASTNGADTINTSFKNHYSTHLLSVICLHSEWQGYLLADKAVTNGSQVCILICDLVLENIVLYPVSDLVIIHSRSESPKEVQWLIWKQIQ